MEDKIFQLKDRKAIESFMKEESAFVEKYLKNSRTIPDSVIIEVLDKMLKDVYVDSIYQDCKKYFADLSQLKADFEDAFKHISYYFPDFKTPKIYTVITGLGNFFGTDIFSFFDSYFTSLFPF